MALKHCLVGYEFHSKKLGEGGFGIVRLAKHESTGQKVAIKIVDKRKLAKDLHRIENEVKAMKNLCHENIVKLLQYEENDDFIYIIMEYCAGGELFDHLLSKRLLESECKRIFTSLINVLYYIHSKGIAHRDIKPENILFDDRMNVKLIDFGLCACSDTNPYATLDCLSTACGSPAYVAPELLQGCRYSGPPVDVWSTGVLLYVLLTGTLPFDSENLAKLYNTIKEGRYVMPQHLNTDVKDLIRRMLCIDPEKRITVPEIMKHKWMNNKFSTKLNLVDEMEFIDEKILLKCSVKFPHLDIGNLRHLVEEKLGYHRATYLLIKQKPELYPDFDRSIHERSNRRRSRSFNLDIQLPNQKKVANDDRTIEVSTPKQTINVIKKSIAPPATEAIQRFGQRTAAVKHTAEKRAPINRNLFNQDSPMAVAKKILAKQSNEKMKIFTEQPKNNNNNNNINKYNNNNYKENNNNNNNNGKENTPKKMMATPTPKKTLLKWLKEIASPRPTNMPRRISSNNTKSLKNIIVTKFFDADKCRDRMIQLFTDKEINCQEKNYTVRCVMSARNVILVACELEIFVCCDDNRVVVQHKRIRGASWDYFKLMTDLQLQLNQSLN